MPGEMFMVKISREDAPRAGEPSAVMLVRALQESRIVTGGFPT